MRKFDFVFHISLRDTYRDNILAMVVDLLLEFNNNEDELKKLLTYVSERYNCLIILDGLDEWSPSITGRKAHTLPRKLPSDQCIYLTACRPYKIENERLTTRDIDRQVNIFGMLEYENYVEAVIQYVNKTRTVQRDVSDFYSEIKKRGLNNHLRIPVITSQLILVWFKQKITNMSRAIIYGNIVEMLFERADKKEPIKLSQMQSCDLQFPESFKELKYVTKYASLIEKVCLLAFRSLFKQDDNVSVLVFTVKKLMSEPYCITNEEMDFLCRLGILSKHKVIGNVGERELKLSFLHKSFIEFYAAMYVSFFDKKDDFHSIIIEWTKLKEGFEYENFLLLLSGLCHQKVNFLIDVIYKSLLDDIQSCRNALPKLDFFDYHYKNNRYLVQIRDLVITLFKEIRVHVDKNACFKLFLFCFFNNDIYHTNFETLKQILLLNKTNVKYLYTDGIFLDEFTQLCNLQYFHIHPPTDGLYDNRFDKLMLQNKTTLHTTGIKEFTFLSIFPIRDLHYLKSLYLENVVVPHECLHDIADYLSNNVTIQSLCLNDVGCSEHDISNSNCLHRINLQHSRNVRCLHLFDVSIIVFNINTLSLKSVTLCPSSNDIARSYIDLFKYLESSKLEYLIVDNESRLLDNNTVNQLVDTIKTISCIKKVELNGIYIPDNKYLLLHSDVTQVEIELLDVSMSDECFLSIVQCCSSNKTNIVVELEDCEITKHGDNYRELSRVESTNNLILQDNKDFPQQSDVTQVKLKLDLVTMSDECFLSFVQCCNSKKADIVVELNDCIIKQHDGGNYSYLFIKGSCDYMRQHLRSIPNVIIAKTRGDRTLKFETGNYH
ncbi:hypothetical protein ACF0H5_024467 [Mactra antiquata]